MELFPSRRTVILSHSISDQRSLTLTFPYNLGTTVFLLYLLNISFFGLAMVAIGKTSNLYIFDLSNFSLTNGTPGDTLCVVREISPKQSHDYLRWSL